MPCTPIRFPGGTRAIVCTARERRRRCSEKGCSSWAVRQCDNPVIRRGVARSCDRHVCLSHATAIGKGRDLCPEHKGSSLAARAATRPVVLRLADEAELYPVVLWRDQKLAGFFERIGGAAARVAFLIAEQPELAQAAWEVQHRALVLAVEVKLPKRRRSPKARSGPLPLELLAR